MPSTRSTCACADREDARRVKRLLPQRCRIRSAARERGSADPRRDAPSPTRPAKTSKTAATRSDVSELAREMRAHADALRREAHARDSGLAALSSEIARLPTEEDVRRSMLELEMQRARGEAHVLESDARARQELAASLRAELSVMIAAAEKLDDGDGYAVSVSRCLSCRRPISPDRTLALGEAISVVGSARRRWLLRWRRARPVGPAAPRRHAARRRRGSAARGASAVGATRPRRHCAPSPPHRREDVCRWRAARVRATPLAQRRSQIESIEAAAIYPSAVASDGRRVPGPRSDRSRSRHSLAASTNEHSRRKGENRARRCAAAPRCEHPRGRRVCATRWQQPLFRNAPVPRRADPNPRRHRIGQHVLRAPSACRRESVPHEKKSCSGHSRMEARPSRARHCDPAASRPARAKPAGRRRRNVRDLLRDPGEEATLGRRPGRGLGDLLRDPAARRRAGRFRDARRFLRDFQATAGARGHGAPVGRGLLGFFAFFARSAGAPPPISLFGLFTLRLIRSLFVFARLSRIPTSRHRQAASTPGRVIQTPADTRDAQSTASRIGASGRAHLVCDRCVRYARLRSAQLQEEGGLVVRVVQALRVLPRPARLRGRRRER